MRLIRCDRITGRWLELGAIRPAAVIKELVNGDRYEHLDPSGKMRTFAVSQVGEVDGLRVIRSEEVMP